MDGNKQNRIVKGALLLTLAGFISKVLSAGYRIPLQNLTGDLGFYIYQQIYPFLGIALVLSLYGFPSAVSKMTAEVTSEGNRLSFTGFYVPIFLLLYAINGGAFLFLYLNSESIAVLMGDANLTSALRFASFTFLLIPFSALLRGIFQGNYLMKPTAFSQIGEQFVRVFIIISMAILLIINNKDIYNIGQAAAIAAIAGSMMAIAVLFVFFVKNKPWGRSNVSTPWSYYCRTLLLFGIIAALNHMVLLIIQFADAFTLVPSLMDFGLSDQDAMETKGVFDRGLPLIQLGTVVGSSFALALIPTISKRNLRRDPASFYYYIRSALTFSIFLSLGATLGLIIIFPEANILLFENDSGTISLRVLAIAILLCSIAITICSILQGLGYIKRTAGFILIAFFVKWLLNQLLVPMWGIIGGSLATVFCLFILCGLAIVELRRKLPGLKFLEQINFRALLIACLGMTGYILFSKFIIAIVGLASRVEMLVYVVFIAISGAIIYFLLLLRFKAFTERQITMLPFAHFLIRIHKGRNPDEQES